MKFRTTTIWVALVSTGMLCLAVGAVRIPRKPKPVLERPSTSTNREADSVPVIPMRVASPAGTSVSGSTGTLETSTQRQPQFPPQSHQSRPQQQRIENFDRRPTARRVAHSRFGAVGNFVASPSGVPSNVKSPHKSGYQEPEAWPFHRKSAHSLEPAVQDWASPGTAVQGSPNAQNKTPIADWPYQPTARKAAGTEGFPTPNTNAPANWPARPSSPGATPSGASPGEQFPTNAPIDPFQRRPNFAATVQQQPLRQQLTPTHATTSDDLLNPALAFGGVSTNGANFQPQNPNPTQPPTAFELAPPHRQPGIASDFEITQPQHSLSLVTGPFADPSASSSSGSIAALPSPLSTTSPAPSLTNHPAPGPAPGQTQNVLEAGHAAPDGQVIQAYAESVTPRNYVTVGQWSGPQNRPVQSIQRVSFDACPDCDDMSRIPAESLINPYAARAGSYPDRTPLPIEAGQLVELPRDYAPWWEEVINKPLRAAPSSRPVNVESLIFEAIEHSPQVTAFRIDPIIRETQILEEAAEFDWQSFIETKFDDSNDPIGNSLTTGDNR